MNPSTQEITPPTLRVASLLTITLLVIVSVASIGMVQTNNDAAATTESKKPLIVLSRFHDTTADVRITLQEGNIETTAYSIVGTNPNAQGNELCVAFTEIDLNTFEYLTFFFGCGPAEQMSINGFRSATWSGTITAAHPETGEEMTVTVNVDLTSTGRVQGSPDKEHTVAPGLNQVITGNGMVAPASGSLDISGDITFSTDDASGGIVKLTSGFIAVARCYYPDVTCI